MANNKSAKKRIKIGKRNKIQNNAYKSLIKTEKKNHLKIVQLSLNDESNDKSSELLIQESFKLAISAIDKAVKKKILHKNTAARKKSSLYRKTFLFTQ